MIKEYFNIIKNDGAIGGWLILLFSLSLLIASFILPPTGLIDNSVLIAVAEVNIFYVLIFKLPNLIASVRDGRELHLKYKDAEVDIKAEKDS